MAWGDPNHLDERSVDLVNNCYLSICFSQMADIAGYLNREEDKARYLEMKRQLNTIIHDTFFDEETGVLRHRIADRPYLSTPR